MGHADLDVLPTDGLASEEGKYTVGLKKPNILMIVTDQQKRDTVGV